MRREIKFTKHGHEFGVATAEEYEKLADTFMFGPMNGDMGECIRPNKRLRNRMNFVTAHFGVAKVGVDILATFYIPKPDTIARHGGLPQLFTDYCNQKD